MSLLAMTELKHPYYHGFDGEDKFVFENFSLPQIGVFVDVGAGPDGIEGSNTYFLERNGWTGPVIDGDPRNFDDLKRNRNNAINAVVSNKEDKTNYWMAEDDTDISGLERTDGNQGTSREVIPIKLEKLLEENNIGKINLLSLDTEGTERDVWKSFDHQKHKPDIIIIEFYTQGKADTGLVSFFKDYGYFYKARVGANLIFYGRWE